jgi:hypothetical protein
VLLAILIFFCFITMFFCELIMNFEAGEFDYMK